MNLHRQYQDLKALLANAASMLQDSDPLQSELCRIPPILKGMESDPVESITPQRHSGTEALRLAAEAIQDLEIQPPWSQKAARRYVGVIQLSPLDSSTQNLPELLNEINEVKYAIERYIVEKYTSRNERFQAMHQACPGALTIHVYRQITILDQQEVQSLRYSWLRKQVLSRVDKQKLLKQLQDEIHRAKPEQILPLKQMYRRIDSVAEEQLRLRRPIKVQPAANIVTSTERKAVTAPLPIFLFQSEPVKMREIPDYDAHQQRKPRADRQPRDILGSFAGVQVECLK